MTTAKRLIPLLLLSQVYTSASAAPTTAEATLSADAFANCLTRLGERAKAEGISDATISQSLL